MCMCEQKAGRSWNALQEAAQATLRASAGAGAGALAQALAWRARRTLGSPGQSPIGALRLAGALNVADGRRRKDLGLGPGVVDGGERNKAKFKAWLRGAARRDMPAPPKRAVASLLPSSPPGGVAAPPKLAAALLLPSPPPHGVAAPPKRAAASLPPSPPMRKRAKKVRLCRVRIGLGDMTYALGVESGVPVRHAVNIHCEHPDSQ